MIRSILFAIALAGAAAPLAAQPQPGERITAEALVERVRPHLPRDFQHGARLVAARAEGQMVVMTVEVPADWLTAGIGTFERFFIAGFCDDRENIFFDNGISIRVDTSARGSSAAPRAGTVFSSCPAAGS